MTRARPAATVGDQIVGIQMNNPALADWSKPKFHWPRMRIETAPETPPPGDAASGSPTVPSVLPLSINPIRRAHRAAQAPGRCLSSLL